jgi:hypothetical protein
MRSSKRDAAATGGTKPEAGRDAVIGAGVDGEPVAAAANRKLDVAAIEGWVGVPTAPELLGEAPRVTAGRVARLR